MKPEPLDGCGQGICAWNQDYKEGKIGGHKPLFEDSDIKSAVDGFCQDLKEEGIHSGKIISVMKFIDLKRKWFKDLMKE